MNKLKPLIETPKGNSFTQFLLVKKAEIKEAKTGKEYLQLELFDSYTSLTAFMWDNFDDIKNSIQAGKVVKVEGMMDEYNGNTNIKIKRLRIATEPDGVDPADFLPKSKKDISFMQKQFTDRIDALKNTYLKTLMQNIFTEDILDKFSQSAAGKSWHHAYVHGLLEHTLEIIKICDLMCDIHKEANRDLLICGAMMHDFGKVEELDVSRFFEYTDKGKLWGHIVISAMLLNEEIKKIPGFPSDLKECLIHLVLSHQGKLDFASPVVPKILEAIILYQADELSAKTNAYKNAIQNEKKDRKWTRRIPLAETELYDHGIADNSKQ
ncbi:MAG: HD domain-containing protein [Bacteroidota bacterium]|nr:HD domain-containing protein [Bacteroidota bacterium]